jgi:hypothetical protein
MRMLGHLLLALLEDSKIGEATIDLTSDNIAKSIINQILSETSKTY